MTDKVHITLEPVIIRKASGRPYGSTDPYFFFGIPHLMAAAPPRMAPKIAAAPAHAKNPRATCRARLIAPGC